MIIYDAYQQRLRNELRLSVKYDFDILGCFYWRLKSSGLSRTTLFISHGLSQEIRKVTHTCICCFKFDSDENEVHYLDLQEAGPSYGS